LENTFIGTGNRSIHHRDEKHW